MNKIQLQAEISDQTGNTVMSFKLATYLSSLEARVEQLEFYGLKMREDIGNYPQMDNINCRLTRTIERVLELETVGAIKDAYNTTEKSDDQPQWEPEIGDKYWFVDHGYVDKDFWDDMAYDGDRRNFLGVYRTRKEAEAMRDKIKLYVKQWR